ncbi:DNA processing protein [Kineosphaera limosa NBRC 100340]|uniref:DNA processing protein n=1 Tax=Kineosphaera limosa NBRC 100340 TaxID=1184609 RepID=K6W636_9MICO|nr:DNA processing protein [Kineosphaera limosa NBRC 100340]
MGIAPEVWARVAWSRLAEPGDLEAAQLVRDHGHVGALALLRHCSGGAALTKILARFRPRWQTLHVAGDLVNAAKVGARIIVPNDPQWPTGVNDLAAPPHVLWVRGSADLRAACERSVAIVGARAATMYGEKIASRIAHDVAARGVSVVSGAAYGIDAAAHRGALSADGSTIAVLACSVERAYPAGHRDLLETIAARGLVVSELPPGCAPLRHRFLERNRLIATMTRGTLVVEAGLRSGSRNTARTAGEHLRVVMAVPGPVTSPSSAGCHAMIRDEQAMLVTDADEVMELIGRMGEDAAPQRRGPDRPGDELEPDERRVFDALGARPRTVEELAVITCLSHAQVGALLGRLSLRRRAERVSGGWIRP